MDLLLRISIVFIIIGFVLAFITRNMKGKKSSTIQSITWGLAGIILIVVAIY